MNDPFRPLRKSFREWRNARRLDREKGEYLRAFLERKLAVPGEQEIAAAIRARFPAVRAVAKGEMGIVAIYHDYGWEEGALRPALERFGKVMVYDWGDRYSSACGKRIRFRKEEMNRDMLAYVRRVVRENAVHVIFTYLSGWLVVPETVRALSSLGVPTANLALNDKEAFVGKIKGRLATGSRDICRHFGICWTSTRDAVEKYCVEGALPLYLPEGANPDLHRPYDLEKTIDVSFVGQCYGERPATIEKLRKAGFRVEAYGRGWPSGVLSTEQMVRVYSRSRINLGFGGVAGHKDTYCLKGRDFEVPMSGGLYLTRHCDELEMFYDVGREIVTYTDFDDLIGKIRWLLAHPADAEAIRKAGRERALKEHTWERRFDRLFRLMGLLE